MYHQDKFFLTRQVGFCFKKQTDFRDKYNNFTLNETKFFRRYNRILYSSIIELNKLNECNINNRNDLLNTIINISDYLNAIYEDLGYKIYNKKEIIGITNTYINFIKENKYNYFPPRLMEMSIEHHKKILADAQKYSFRDGTKIFINKIIRPQEARASIIRMLFARDYFNIDAILLLREYLMNSPMANITLKMDTLNKNPSNDFFSIFLSDYKIINNILYIYENSNFRFEQYMLSYQPYLDINGELNIILFDYICSLIYSRCIIAIYISLIESIPATLMFDKKIFGKDIDETGVEQSLLRIYRTLGLSIFTLVYDNLSLSEIIWFQHIMTLDDILVYSYYVASISRTKELASLLAIFASHEGHLYSHSMLIEIIENSIQMWRTGCEYSHIEMIKYFENSKKYGKYFSERGFKRNLIRELKIRMKAEGINKIVGYDYYPKGYKRPRKKKRYS